VLAFKNNIYDGGGNPSGSQPDPYQFLLLALVQDRNVLSSMVRYSTEEAIQQLTTLFPHASRFAPLPVLDSLSKRLMEGLVDTKSWFRMNAYHLCYVHDSLYGWMEDYSYADREQRMTMMPDLEGKPIDFEAFLDQYFHNTAFLMDPDRFNALTVEEKQQRGLTDDCLFGTINKFIPSEQEITLEILPGNPYETC